MSLNTVSRVQLTIDILGSSYGTGWKVEDIFEQAGREAKSYIRNVCKAKDIAIIGEPIVRAVTSSDGN